jgi:hypothetical protein
MLAADVICLMIVLFWLMILVTSVMLDTEFNFSFLLFLLPKANSWHDF